MGRSSVTHPRQRKARWRGRRLAAGSPAGPDEALYGEAVEALLVLIGALVGAGGSTGGSILVNRWQLTRQSRIRAYDELLPQINTAVAVAVDAGRNQARPADLSSLWNNLMMLRRAAAMAGRADRRQFAAVEEAGRRIWAETPDVAGWGELGPSLAAHDQHEPMTTLQEELGRYGLWLEDKIR
jgi:hypothetical protein